MNANGLGAKEPELSKELEAFNPYVACPGDCDHLRVTGGCLGFPFGPPSCHHEERQTMARSKAGYELFADENNATVSSTTAIGRIACDWVGFAIAFGREAATVNAMVAKPIHDGLGTIIRKL